MISSGKCLMLFLRQDSSFGPSVYHIFFFFFLGGLGGGANLKGGAYLKEGANSSIYGNYNICIYKF